jgi:hypothetical protein
MTNRDELERLIELLVLYRDFEGDEYEMGDADDMYLEAREAAKKFFDL